MVEVDISNIWGELSLPDLLKLEKPVFYAHRSVAAAPEEFGLTQSQLEREFKLYSYENPAWLYTAARKLLFGLGRTKERVEFCGNGADALVSVCEFLPADPAGTGSFVTLIGMGVTGEELAERADRLALEGEPVITLCPETPEQLRLFFRFSAALWEKLA